MLDTAPLRLMLVGCGKMGAAMLKGWLDLGLIETTHILDPNGIPADMAHDPKLHHITDINQLDFTTLDMMILAVKPQIIGDICQDLAPHTPETLPILSIAAGQSLEKIGGYFKQNQPLIRAMPNTPAAIGKGITAAITNHSVSHETKCKAEAILRRCGDLIWLENEPLMDSVTALSGSGPAYIFHLIEVMAQTGENIGLDKDQAMQLARQTVIGAASLAEADSTSSASTLRENVTSPNGTTQAALDILMDGRLQALFDEALNAAKIRSIELSK